MELGSGFWRAFCFYVQIFFIPLLLLEASCGCQTEVGETGGHFYEVSLGVEMARLATRQAWKEISLPWHSASASGGQALQEEAHGMKGKRSLKVNQFD